MRFGNHEPGSPRDRRRNGFRPTTERLEARELLAIDLVNIAGSTDGSTPGPYGVALAGQNNNGATGFSVADVGDVNGDGYDDMVISQSTAARSGTGLVLGNGANARVFLVFGSRDVNLQTFDFLNLNPQQRIGDLAALGNTSQTNPINGAPGFNYDGLTFTSSQNPNSALGASVAGVGDVNGDGFADFMIGAPGSSDSSGNNNAAGRAYLVYGGTNLLRPNKSVDLDNPTGNSDLNILTFVNNIPNGAVGRAVSSAGDIFPDGTLDIAIGAPNASVNGLPTSGGIYVISGGALSPARSQTIPLQFVGQGGANNVPGVVFAGANSGEAAGYSLAAAGNFARNTVGAVQQSDLLIGAPQFNVGPGEAFLVYGSAGLAGQATTANGFSSISLGRVGASDVLGAVFTGAATGDETGFAVSTAGDFNNDGTADIMIGSPGFNNFTGRVNIILGRPANPATPGPILGTFALSTLGASVPGVELDGAATGALAGFALTATGRINGDTINEVAIGSPGFNNSQGVVYIVPGNPDLQGTFSLAAAESQPISALAVTISQPAGTFIYLGTSVSGRLGVNGQGRTTDGDGVGDLVIGAAGFGVNTGRSNAGAAFLLEGAFLPVPNVVSTAITSPIGVGTPVGPFTVDATTPADLRIYILSKGSNTPGFNPFRDIDPATITVNGVALPDPGTFTQDVDEDGDGIPDAYFTFSPRSLLGLTNLTTSITVSARTLATSPTPNRRYTGTATITVVGGGNGGNGSGSLPSDRTAAFFGFPNAGTTAALPIGERLVPTDNTLSRLAYKPLSLAQAHRQFYPTNGFAYRYHQFYHPDNGNNIFGGNATRKYKAHGIWTLSRQVFTRGKFPNGVYTGRINHKGKTIPPNP